MSDWKGHITAGILFSLPIFILFLYLHRDFNIFISLITIIIYSQLPDIDTRASQIRWIFTITTAGIALVSILFGKSLYAIIALGSLIVVWIMGLIKGFGHRGFTHSIIAAVLLSALLLFINIETAVFGLVAYCSHLFLDHKHKVYK